MTECGNEFINGIGKLTQKAAKRLLKPTFGTTAKLVPKALDEIAVALQRFISRMELEIQKMPPHNGGSKGYEREFAACANALATKKDAAGKIFSIFADDIVGREVRLTAINGPKNESNWENKLEESYKKVSLAVATKMALGLFNDEFEGTQAFDRYTKISNKFVGLAFSDDARDSPIAPSAQVVLLKEAIQSIPQGQLLKFLDERYEEYMASL